jgi:DinB family protein
VSTSAPPKPAQGEAAPPPAELLAVLAEMPELVARAGVSLDAGTLRRPGPDGAFSLVEHAWHLADLERMGYAERLRRLHTENEPALPDFDGARVARESDYRSRSFADGVGAFRDARGRNIAVLQALPASAWSRAGTQEGVGPVRLADIPRMMAEHDAGHREEIRALLAALRRG